MMHMMKKHPKMSAMMFAAGMVCGHVLGGMMGW